MRTVAIVGAVAGLFTIGAAVYTIWLLFFRAGRYGFRPRRESGEEDGGLARREIAGALFLKWTLWDYAVLLLFICGMLLHLSDLAAVYRDRVSYPQYHFAYLLAGFVLTLIGAIFMLIRLGVVLQLTRAVRMPLPDDHHKPDQADPSE